MTPAMTNNASPKPLQIEVFDRAKMALFMAISSVAAFFVLKPELGGHIQLIALSLAEISAMVIFTLWFGGKNVTRDINELNFYALMAHLVYLPAYFNGVSSIYHSTAINILMCLAVVRLLYVGPRTADGSDFKGLPTFGLLGHVQEWLANKEQTRPNAIAKFLPHALFFGSALPLWFIMVRSNDLVVTGTVAGLMLFIYLMALQFQNAMDAAHAQIAVLNAQIAARTHAYSTPAPAPITPITPTTPTAPSTQVTPAIATQVTSQPDMMSARDLSALILAAYGKTHQDLRPILAAVNLHFAHQHPQTPPAIAVPLKERRIELLDNLSILMTLATHQSRANISDDDLANLNGTFSQLFDHQMIDATLRKYIDFVSEINVREASDTSIYLACDALTLAWLKIIFDYSNDNLAEQEQLKQLTCAIIEKFWPTEYGVD